MRDVAVPSENKKAWFNSNAQLIAVDVATVVSEFDSFKDSNKLAVPQENKDAADLDGNAGGNTSAQPIRTSKTMTKHQAAQGNGTLNRS